MGKQKLIEDDVFNTKTMAKVYEGQGKYDEAVRIYQYLLNREPDRQDLIDALSELQEKRFEDIPEGLVHLFAQWIDLLIASNGLKKLEKLRSHLKDRR